MKKLTTVMLVLLVAFASFAQAIVEENAALESSVKTPGSYTLKVFETTDIHGHIIDVSSSVLYKQNKAKNGEEPTYTETSVETVNCNLAWIADKINDAREATGYDSVLLLDGGDIYQGETVSNMFKGQPLVAAMALMGYDAVTIGNHEYDWEIATTVDADGTMPDYSFGSYVGESLVPVVAYNTYLNGESAPFTNDYVIVEKTAVDAEGNKITVKIGIIGSATDYKADIMTSRFTGAGFTIDFDGAKLNELASYLETEMGCDATVLLHHGAAKDAGNKLGEGSCIDLVCGGHSHGTVADVVNGIVCIQGGSKAKNYAYAEMVFDVDADGNVAVTVQNASTPKVASKETEFNYSNVDNLDSDIVRLTYEAYKIMSDELGQVFAKLPEGVEELKGTELQNMINRSTVKQTGCDMFITNTGGIRTNLNSNAIKLSDFYAVLPFADEVWIYTITAKEFVDYIAPGLMSGGFGGQGVCEWGVDVYHEDGVLNAVVLNDDGNLTPIYVNGQFVVDENTPIKVGTNNYIGTLTKNNNPFMVYWDGQYDYYSLNDAETAIAYLTAEYEANGVLTIDSQKHVIKGAYPAN